MLRAFVRTALSLLVLALVPLGAHAQLFRAYLASYGSDTNPCTVAQPCRLVPAALNAVAAGGEIWILDSANYNSGTVSITKSVSIIVVPGQIGSIVAANGTAAIAITTSVSLALRNVVIANNATNPGTYGLFVSGGSAGDFVSVEDCLFSNIQNAAIVMDLTPSRLYVKNSVFRNNNLAIEAVSGPTVEITDSRIFGSNSAGVEAFGSGTTTTMVNITDSTISGGGAGVIASIANTSTANVTVTLTRSTVHDSGIGVQATTFGTGNALVVVSNSTVSNNGNGYKQAGTGSVVKSLGNNYIGENGGGDIGTLTTTPQR